MTPYSYVVDINAIYFLGGQEPLRLIVEVVVAEVVSFPYPAWYGLNAT